MLLGALTEGLDVRPVAHRGGPGGGGVRICDITEDSRTVLPGSLFVARKGEKSDGNAYIDQAVAAGAVAVLSDNPRAGSGPSTGAAGAVVLTSPDVPGVVAHMAERFFGGPSSRLSMVGITGTKGKTTCAYLVHQLLNGAVGSHSQHKAGLIGTVCIDDGVEVAPAQLTTPPALELSRTIARMVEAGCTACVMETSSHALDQRRVAGLAYRVAVFTNLGHDHLDYHQSMEAYAAAKARLFAGLPADGLAVVNADDPYAPVMLAGCKARVVRVTMRARASAAEPSADCSARVVSQSTTGTQIDVVAPFTGGRPVQLHLPLLGHHNVINALQAACVAHELGVTGPALINALSGVNAPPGRLQPVTGPDAPFCVYVDYAHTPDSLAAVLKVARQAVEDAASDDGQPAGRVVALFGCGGDRDRTKRPRMGAVAAELADSVIVTSDNPRSEDPAAIIREVVAGVPASAHARLRVEPDRAAAIAAAVASARPRDVVILAGKGHEDYQIIADGQGGTRKSHFDDREQAVIALKARGVSTEPFVAGRLVTPLRASAHPHPSIITSGPVRHTANGGGGRHEHGPGERR